MGADVVEKMAVMGDDDDGADIVHQEILQPGDGGDIQMVGGFVEQDDVGLAEQGPGQQDFDLVPVGQAAHRFIKQILGQAEPLQDPARLGFGLPAVQLGEFPFQLGGEDAVLLGKILFGIEGILLLHDLEQAGIALEDGVQNRLIVVGEMILAQHRHPGLGVDGHLTGGRLQIA